MEGLKNEESLIEWVDRKPKNPAGTPGDVGCINRFAFQSMNKWGVCSEQT